MNRTCLASSYAWGRRIMRILTGGETWSDRGFDARLGEESLRKLDFYPKYTSTHLIRDYAGADVRYKSN